MVTVDNNKSRYAHSFPCRGLLLVPDPRRMGRDMPCIWRDEGRLGDEEGARDRGTLRVVCHAEVGVNVHVVRAYAGERCEDETVAQRHITNLDGLEKSRYGFRLFSHVDSDKLSSSAEN